MTGIAGKTFAASRSALRAACWLVLAAAGLPCFAAADGAVEFEYKVKAGYLFNFSKFVQWPAGAFAAPKSPFVIGVMDGGEAHPVVAALLKDKLVDGRPIEVKRVEPKARAVTVHMLLVTRLAEVTPEQVRQLCGANATLIVGETVEFAERGGAIGFLREDDTVRVAICLDHATQLGLKVSSKLASVAKPVRSKRSS